MSSCLGGGRAAAAYGFDLEIVKSPPSTSTATRTISHNTPSPSSTLSESTSPLVISTRKPRMPRKRPNQTYSEAAALLSTAYPNIFSSNDLFTHKFPSNSQSSGIKSPPSNFDVASELLISFGSIEDPDFLFQSPLQANANPFFEQKEVIFDAKCGGGGIIDDSEVNFRGKNGGVIDDSEANLLDSFDDFDAGSILDEEIEDGIDSIMGNAKSNEEEIHENGNTRAEGINIEGNCYGIGRLGQLTMDPWHGSSMRLGIGGNFSSGFELRSALRDNDDANWWRSPTVDFDQISPRSQTSTTSAAAAGNAKSEYTKKKSAGKAADKKKKKVSPVESKNSESGLRSNQNPKTEERPGPLLKLNYDKVLEAWSDKASPFCDKILGPDDAQW